MSSASTPPSPASLSPSPAKPAAAAPVEPSPSASVVLVSPTNRVLLLRRVAGAGRSFAAAHVFPGGNVSGFHDGVVPREEPSGGGGRQVLLDERRDRDSEIYRIAAVRETFEESGILLARKRGGGYGGGELLRLDEETREEGRRAVHGNRVRFNDWLDSVGAVADTGGCLKCHCHDVENANSSLTENLIPMTRWITPASSPKRFTTQMYLYLLPLSSPTRGASSKAGAAPPLQALKDTSESSPSYLVPTPDGGIEHTEALFGEPITWLQQSAIPLSEGGIIMFPPQAFLLNLLARFFSTPPDSSSQDLPSSVYESQRRALLSFLAGTPTDGSGKPEALIPWRDKIISPVVLGSETARRKDGRIVLALHSPRGDWEHVAVVRFAAGKGLAGATEVEILPRRATLGSTDGIGKL